MRDALPSLLFGDPKPSKQANVSSIVGNVLPLAVDAVWRYRYLR